MKIPATATICVYNEMETIWMFGMQKKGGVWRHLQTLTLTTGEVTVAVDRWMQSVNRKKGRHRAINDIHSHTEYDFSHFFQKVLNRPVVFMSATLTWTRTSSIEKALICISASFSVLISSSHVWFLAYGHIWALHMFQWHCRAFVSLFVSSATATIILLGHSNVINFQVSGRIELSATLSALYFCKPHPLFNSWTNSSPSCKIFCWQSR